MEEKEIWRIYYQGSRVTWEVSNYGRVKKNGEIYECKTSNRGYLFFGGGYVHKIVAQLFILNLNNYNEVDHIDGNKLNNHFLNLRWVTHKQNMNNPNTRKRISKAIKGKLSSEEIKTKMSEAHKGEKCYMYGTHHSEERKAKLSAAKKGRHIVLCEDGKRHWQ